MECASTRFIQCFGIFVVLQLPQRIQSIKKKMMSRLLLRASNILLPQLLPFVHICLNLQYKNKNTPFLSIRVAHFNSTTCRPNLWQSHVPNRFLKVDRDPSPDTCEQSSQFQHTTTLLIHSQTFPDGWWQHSITCSHTERALTHARTRTLNTLNSTGRCMQVEPIHLRSEHTNIRKTGSFVSADIAEHSWNYLFSQVFIIP